MKIKYSFLLAVVLVSASCKKGFLDAKPDQSLLIPKTLSDFSALLDNLNVFNQVPCLQLVASDDFYITDNGWQALSTVQERNGYYWADDVYETVSSVNDWDTPYKQVFYVNVVLDGLEDLDSNDNTMEYNRIKGTALFCRAFALYNVAQLFAMPYHADGDHSLPGVPVRLTSDVNVRSARGTLQETYDQILHDLETAANLLPEQVSVKSRPCKAAALALLARICLSMEDYPRALSYANEALGLRNTLINYNSINGSVTRPMPVILPNGNDEVLYYAFLLTYTYTTSSLVYADPALYSSYSDKDLRKSLFFSYKGPGTATFRGSYTGNIRLFGGLAVDELYMIRAECLARSGDLAAALAALDSLLINRYSTGQYTPSAVNSSAEVLSLILSERRKELIGRGLRWTDLRRLNNDVGTAVTLGRTLNGKDYQLLPGAGKYVFPIPTFEVQASGLEQNPR